MIRILCAALLASLLGGCAGPYIDRTHVAESQRSRVKFLILHYTVADAPDGDHLAALRLEHREESRLGGEPGDADGLRRR